MPALPTTTGAALDRGRLPAGAVEDPEPRLPGVVEAPDQPERAGRRRDPVLRLGRVGGLVGLHVEVERAIRVVVQLRAVVDQVAVERVVEQEDVGVVEGHRPEGPRRNRKLVGRQMQDVAPAAGQRGEVVRGLRERVDRDLRLQRPDADPVGQRSERVVGAVVADVGEQVAVVVAELGDVAAGELRLDRGRAAGDRVAHPAQRVGAQRRVGGRVQAGADADRAQLVEQRLVRGRRREALHQAAERGVEGERVLPGPEAGDRRVIDRGVDRLDHRRLVPRPVARERQQPVGVLELVDAVGVGRALDVGASDHPDAVVRRADLASRRPAACRGSPARRSRSRRRPGCRSPC